MVKSLYTSLLSCLFTDGTACNMSSPAAPSFPSFLFCRVHRHEVPLVMHEEQRARVQPPARQHAGGGLVLVRADGPLFKLLRGRFRLGLPQE